MIRSVQIISTLALIAFVLFTGFVLFTEQVMERSTQPFIKTNLSQLAVSDLGFIYLDAQTDVSITSKAEQLLMGNYIQELYIAYDEEGELAARELNQSLAPFGNRIHLTRKPGELLTTLYNICQEQHDCSMMMIGQPGSVKHAIFLALEIGQPAIGYVAPNSASSTEGINEMINHVSAYFSTKSLSAQLEKEFASL